MRILVLAITALILGAAALPASAACPYKQQVAQSDQQNSQGAQSAVPIVQKRG